VRTGLVQQRFSRRPFNVDKTYGVHGKNGFVAATKLGQQTKFLLLQPKILLQQPNVLLIGLTILLL